MRHAPEVVCVLIVLDKFWTPAVRDLIALCPNKAIFNCSYAHIWAYEQLNRKTFCTFYHFHFLLFTFLLALGVTEIGDSPFHNYRVVWDERI